MKSHRIHEVGNQISAVYSLNFTIFLFHELKSETNANLISHMKYIGTHNPLFLDHSNKKILSLFGGFYNVAAIDSEGTIIFIPKSISSLVSEKFATTRLQNNEEAVCIACCIKCIYALGSRGRFFASKPGIEKFERKLLFILIYF